MAAQRRNKQKPAVVSGPVEIPDAEHESMIERVAAIDVAKAAGKVGVRLPDKSGRRFSQVWDVPARIGAIGELAEQLIEAGIEKVADRVHLGLLADLVLPAGGGGAVGTAGQRPGCEECAGPAQDRQARCGVVGQS